MDSSIIQFPTDAVREWVRYEKIIHRALEQHGASSEMTKEVCARMKEAFEKFRSRFDFSYQLPPLPEGLGREIHDSINKALKTFADQVHEYTSQLMLDRLLLGIELYNLRHVSTKALSRDLRGRITRYNVSPFHHEYPESVSSWLTHIREKKVFRPIYGNLEDMRGPSAKSRRSLQENCEEGQFMTICVRMNT